MNKNELHNFTFALLTFSLTTRQPFCTGGLGENIVGWTLKFTNLVDLYCMTGETKEKKVFSQLLTLLNLYSQLGFFF